jgi:hypothetical protein
MKRYISRCFRRIHVLSLGFLLVAMTNLEVPASFLLKLVNSFKWRSKGAVIDCCFVCVLITNSIVSDRFSVHQESSTVYTSIDICHTRYADCLLAGFR